MQKQRKQPVLREEPALLPERDDVRVGANRCPFCHTAVRQEEDQVVCRSCLGRHHTSCWEESKACSCCGAREYLDAAKGRSSGLPWLSTLGVVGLGGALTATCAAVSTHDLLFLVLPLLSCFLAGVVSPRARAVWLAPLGFLASFFVTLGLWMGAGTIESLTGFHLGNYAGAVFVVGWIAARAGRGLAKRWARSVDEPALEGDTPETAQPAS